MTFYFDFLEYGCNLSDPKQPPSNTTKNIRKWEKPRTSLIKGNFDASIKEGRGTSFGVIFKNNNGEVLAAAAKILPYFPASY